jgi:hypothetical protein
MPKRARIEPLVLIDPIELQLATEFVFKRPSRREDGTSNV